MKQVLGFFLCYILICQYFTMTTYAKPEWPLGTEILAEGAIVIDADSGAILFEKNSHQPYPPASITKLLTALLVIEHSELNEIITFSEDAVENVEGGSGNKLNVAAGDKLSVEDCLYSLLLQSCNQVANALAEHVSGSREAFVELMNKKVKELGCTESNFANPSGLNDDNQYVTPFDMALIAKAAFDNPKVVELSSALTHEIGPTINNPSGRTIYMEHKLLSTSKPSSQFYYPDAIAGKIGYTSKAGNTLVTYAQRDGKQLISVVLKGTQPQYYLDGKTILENGFNQFQNLNISQNETAYTTGETPIIIGTKSYPPEQLELDPNSVITLPKDAVYADVDKTLEIAMPKDRPKNAVALIKYTYEQKEIGQAYLSLKDTAIPITEPEIPKQALLNEDETAAKPSGGSQIKSIITIIVIILIVGSSGYGYIFYKGQKENRRLALKQKKRRQRLKEDNCSEEEFERLLKLRTQTRKKISVTDKTKSTRRKS